MTVLIYIPLADQYNTDSCSGFIEKNDILVTDSGSDSIMTLVNCANFGFRLFLRQEPTRKGN